MSNDLKKRIISLERVSITREDRINCILIVHGNITDEEQRLALDEYYNEYPQDRNPVRIITLELRPDQSGKVKAWRGH